MSRRARYVGPFDEVTVHWPPGETVPGAQQKWTVKQNHWLPDDAPAALRDELTQAGNADWTEVEQAAPAKKGEGDK